HDARKPDLFMKLLRRAHGILAGHGVSDEKNLDRRGLLLDLLQLDHQLFVNVQAARGVNQQCVVARQLTFAQSAAYQLKRLIDVRRFEDRLLNGLTDDRKLLAGGGPINVDREQERATVLFFGKELGDLAGGGRLAGALQTDDHYDVRRALGK